MTYLENINIRKPLDLFDSVEVVQRQTLVEIKPTYGLSAFRDKVTTTGSGSVSDTVGQSEFAVSTGTTAGSTAELKNTERGRYVPGSQGQIGEGVRLNTSTISGTGKIEWSYSTETDGGFGFGLDANGAYVFIENAGTTKVYQENWNIDTFDGTGVSGVNLDLTEGYIFQIDYSWYGYGDIVFKIIAKQNGQVQRVYPVHVYSPSQKTSLAIPNLPLRINVDNGDQATDLIAYVGGRQYSVLTPSEVNARINSDIRALQTGVGTTFVPTVSFVEKTEYNSVSVKLAEIDIITDATLEWQLRLAPTLTGASFGTPSNTSATETACDSDTSATAITGGELLDRGIISAGGAGINASGSISSQVTKLDIPEEEILTLAVRRLSGTGATVTSVLKWAEEW